MNPLRASFAMGVRLPVLSTSGDTVRAVYNEAERQTRIFIGMRVRFVLLDEVLNGVEG